MSALAAMLRLTSREEVLAERQRRTSEATVDTGYLSDAELGELIADLREHDDRRSPVVTRLCRRADFRQALGLPEEREAAWGCVDVVPGCRCTEAAINRAEVADMTVGDLVDLVKAFATRAHRAVDRKSPAASTPPEVPLASGGRSSSLLWPREAGRLPDSAWPEPEPVRPTAARTSLSPAHVPRRLSDGEVQDLNERMGFATTSRSYTKHGRIYWEN